MGFGNEVYEWPNSYAFARYVLGDSLEAHGIAGDFQVFGDDPKEESLLKRLESYRDMDDAIFDECVVALGHQVKNHALTSLHQIWMAYRQLSYLSRKKLTGWTEAACLAMFLTAIQTYDPNAPVHAGIESFGDRMDDNDKKVWAALQELQAKIEAVEQAKIDERDQQAIIEGDGNMPQRAGIAPFANADAQDIYDRLKVTGTAGLNRMTRFYARRRQVANIMDAVRKEVPFAGALADRIDANKLKGKKVTLTEAAWTDLRDQLRGFIQWAG